MAYGLHIERSTPIELEEWCSVVRANPLLQLDESATVSTNPASGQQVTVQGQPGSTSANLQGQWVKVFRWRRGKVSFNAPSSTSAHDPVMALALQLAVSLGAIVRGDEGEPYGGSA
jgi:hypothetical protein